MPGNEVGSQRQAGGPLVSSLKNLSAHQLESENFRSQLQNQSPIANGYMQGRDSFQARHNETNLLGMDTAPTGSSSLDSPIGNGPGFHKNGSLRLESTVSPINYDLIGRQQQFGVMDPGMIQPLPRQQSGMTDMQLLQQHAIMQELQRHQLPKPQFHFPEARQLSSANQVSSVKEESVSLSSAPIDGFPVLDASSYSWQPERMTQNANCMQHGASPAMGGSSGMFSPGQGQMCLMGMVPQQVDESFYGISTTGARGNAYQYSFVQMDKPLMQKVPASSHSFLDNQYIFRDQVRLLDGTLVSRQCEQDNNVFEDVAGQGLNSEFHSENLQQTVIQPKTVPILESPQRQEHCSTAETSLKKSAIQVSSSQTVATLDPIEEKILFGSDDSMWDILGKSTNLGSALDGTGSLRGFPSPQSGIWSTLMMSAVAETSSSDIGVQEQWSGSDLQNCEPPRGNMPASTVNDGTKQQSAWADNNFPSASLLNSKSMSNTYKLVLPENNANQNFARMQRDIEGFGYYSRPKNAVHEEQAMSNIEVGPSNRSIKRFKGPSSDSSLEAQQVCSQGEEQLSNESNALMRDAHNNHPLVPSGDSKLPSSLPNAGYNCETQLSTNMLAFVQNESQHFPNSNNPAANIRGEHTRISPQTAPSWFDQYGAIKTGKMLPVYDTKKVSIVGRAFDSLHVHSSEHDADPLDKVRQSSNFMPIETEYVAPHSLPPDIASQNLVVARAMKRKIMTFEFLPWHREVTQGSQRPQNISVAEVEWAHEANRLIEKVEDEPEMIEDWLPALGSKRRLVLTTQLLQQLLRAPPRVVLSADARKNYDTLAYFVARSVLGDTCSLKYIPESDTAVPHSGSILSEKQREQRNQSIFKAAEGFINRAEMLENSLWSLIKRASVSDLRLECQDQEKVSVITRLAKFHSRGQANGAHKFFGQRYVIALPMPKNLPDRVQCLSL